MDGDELIKLVRALFDRYDVQPKNPAMVGDLADLSLTVSGLSEAVERVLTFNKEGPDGAREFGAALAALHERVNYLQSVCSDIAEPLKELAEERAGPEGIIEALTGGVAKEILSFDSPADGSDDLEH